MTVDNFRSSAIIRPWRISGDDNVYNSASFAFYPCRVIAQTLQMLATTRFKEAPVKLAMHDGAGGARVETLQNMLMANNEKRGVA